MSCKQCGVQWTKDVTTEELEDELARRTELAKNIEEEFFATRWIDKERYFRVATWLPVVVTLTTIFALLCVAPILPWMIENLGFLPSLFLLLFGTVMPPILSLLPERSYYKKLTQLRGEFKELNPEEARLLRSPSQ